MKIGRFIFIHKHSTQPSQALDKNKQKKSQHLGNKRKYNKKLFPNRQENIFIHNSYFKFYLLCVWERSKE